MAFESNFMEFDKIVQNLNKFNKIGIKLYSILNKNVWNLNKLIQ